MIRVIELADTASLQVLTSAHGNFLEFFDRLGLALATARKSTLTVTLSQRFHSKRAFGGSVFINKGCSHDR